MAAKCFRCECPATTSRDGRPACWWCSDVTIDGVPCATCTPALPIDTHVVVDCHPTFEAPFALSHEVVERTRIQEGLF